MEAQQKQKRIDVVLQDLRQAPTTGVLLTPELQRLAQNTTVAIVAGAVFGGWVLIIIMIYFFSFCLFFSFFFFSFLSLLYFLFVFLFVFFFFGFFFFLYVWHFEDGSTKSVAAILGGANTYESQDDHGGKGTLQ
jgi:Ca2+/Na+ antiporter